MRVFSLLDNQKRSRFFAKITKKMLHIFSPPVSTAPVFLMGTQRSGTTMLMFSLHLHPDTEVFDESVKNKAFIDYRIQGLDTINDLIIKSKFKAICFKPLADSHLIKEFMTTFPSARFIWAIRDYRDVANSSLRKWSHSTRAMKIVLGNQLGGGWFQEGISDETLSVLQTIPRDDLSEFDLACLVWWVRNMIYVENDLANNPNVLTVIYEELVTEPGRSFGALFRFLGLKPCAKTKKYIHSRSIAKNNYPKINPAVEKLCNKLTKDIVAQHKI